MIDPTVRNKYRNVTGKEPVKNAGKKGNPYTAEYVSWLESKVLESTPAGIREILMNFCGHYLKECSLHTKIKIDEFITQNEK